ncbi:MAG: bifunctional diaminohydroxyphosphoribosylaminopyrimidine deaminase/5-amino-6-(5-phosphoribosylamino)uracil reductase RibD [Fibrobacter sp.]|nr:bifunctional diaminohydroxyphosphoribosylaminopyrimidine deaminase/5-amino-6-(5-phosphoribosylamino)uracil reductase RibD [Fibrobacter sp.]
MTKTDRFYIRMAYSLAKKAKGLTFPNPAVGAVIVKDGKVIGKGATQFAGGHHAEKIALFEAGELACDATLYVTLEPCCHFGRTPPCTDAIIKAGISRVVITQKDPNPLVSGKGIKQLRESGIRVDDGIFEKEAPCLNEDYYWSIQHKKCWITLKLAMTLDGRIADGSNISKWITSEKSRSYVHELRRMHAAVGVGRSTLDYDNPQLTVRHKKGYNPARVIFSSSADTPVNSYFFQHAHDTRSIVVVRSETSKIKVDEKSGIEYWFTGELDHSKSMNIFREIAYSYGISSIFVEGGQRIASLLLEKQMVNRVYFFYGNRILGAGREGLQFSRGLSMPNCISLDNIELKSFSNDMMITGTPVYSKCDS